MKRLNFWENVNKQGPWQPHLRSRCWEWTAGQSRSGYGTAAAGDVRTNAHRVAWFLTHGCWPTPMCLHRCDNRICVRPSHLYEGNQVDNMRDAHARHRVNRKGEAGGHHTLTEKDVLYIRRIHVPYAEDGRGCVALGKRFGVTKECIYLVVKRKIWRHL